MVADRDESDGIVAILGEAGYEHVLTGDGGDATLSLFAEEQPDVAVIRASLDAGDARSLSAAMRSTSDGEVVEIVLIGDEHGPIRNALDAADFDVDRFVGRPLSPKALAFAVRLCAQAARGKRAAIDTGRHIEEQLDRAVDDFVRDAMGALAMTGMAPVPVPASDPDEETLPLPEGEPAAEPEPEPDAPPAWREPTVILSDGGASADPPPASDAPSNAPSAGIVDVSERASVDESWDDVSSRLIPPVSDDDSQDGHEGVGDVDDLDEDFADDFDDDLDDLDDLHADLERGADHGGAPAAKEPAPPQNGGGFARELRRKMSVMAERLFPGKPAAGAVDVGVAHDHHTEIDFSALGVDEGRRDDDEIEEVATVATYAHYDTDPSPDGFTDQTTRPRISTGPRGGPLRRGHDSVATLIARMFSEGFTGRVAFRDGKAEKTISFQEGRPVFATSNLPHDRMGDLLFREGKITREQHARSRELVLESGRRMGEILVDKGFLKRRELLPAVRRHIEDVIYSLFAWEDGEYEVAAGDYAAAERIRLSRHPAAMILEGIRRKYTLDVLAPLLGSGASVVDVPSRERLDAVVDVADLIGDEQEVIAAFDGSRTVDEVIATTGADALTVYQMARGLEVLGVARIDRVGGEGTGAEAARAPSLVGETDIAIDRQRVLAKFSLVSEADYFALLGVRRDATAFEIRRAYEAARRDYSADSFPAEVLRELGGEIAEINELLEEAYHVLRDDGLRGAYLANLRD